MSPPPTVADTSTELARERNRAAADRTLMAWIRTSLSLISFGFGAGKVNDYLETTGRPLDSISSLRLIGTALIGLGVLALFAAVLQHVRLVRRLRDEDFRYHTQLPVGLLTAVLLLVIGTFAFFAIHL